MTLLEEICAEPISDTPVVPEPLEVEIPEEKPTITISALGGKPSVEVDEGAFRRLVIAAGADIAGDFTSQDMGRLIDEAKRGRSAMLESLLSVRANTTLYRVRTAEGRPWRLKPRPALTLVDEIEQGSTPVELENNPE